MRTKISLFWWLLLGMSLEGVAYVLDSHHHLASGRLGIFLLKAFYLGFAIILLFRYLSLGSQQAFERMLDSYNKIASSPWSLEEGPKQSPYKLLFYMVLLGLGLSGFLVSTQRRPDFFLASQILDTGVWIFGFAWLTRAYWLKALARRERLKEFLDDARSLRKTAMASPEGQPHMGMLPFLVLFFLFLAFTAGLSAMRWKGSDRTFRLDSLKACLGKSMHRERALYHENGRVGQGMNEESCLEGFQGGLRFSLEHEAGRLALGALETGNADFFGNGRNGDQALWLDGEGRFRLRGRKGGD